MNVETRPGDAPIDVRALATNVRRSEGSLWVGLRRSSVSYPEEAGARCLALVEQSFWFAHRNRCIVALVSRFPPGGVLWDVGGGNGFVSRALLDAGFKVAVLEPNLPAARDAVRRGVDPVVCSTLQDAEFHERSLAAAGLFDVLEHQPDDHAFLAGLHRVLKPGARLYLTLPAHAWLWSTRDVQSGHFRRYTEPGLASVLARSGFRVEHSTYFFQPLVLPILLFRSLPGRLWRRRPTRPAAVRAEHVPRVRLARLVLDRLLRREERRLRAGARQAVGASLLVSAVKAV